MKIRIEQTLHVGSAAVTLAAVFGLNPVIVALSLAAISVGLAVLAGLSR